jgi:hypothetical protein
MHCPSRPPVHTFCAEHVPPPQHEELPRHGEPVRVQGVTASQYQPCAYVAPLHDETVVVWQVCWLS